MEREIEAQIFFNNHLKNHPYFIGDSLRRAWGWRKMGLEAWKEGKLSFGEMAQNFLPGRCKSKKALENFGKYVNQGMDDLFKRSGLYEAPHILLFGLPFRPAKEKTAFDSWFIFFITYFQLCVMDQYHTKDFLKEDSVVIEAGGNIGVFSVLVARLCKSGCVFVFEPNPSAFEALKHNTSYYPNVKVYQKALGAHAGRDILFTHVTSNMGFLSSANEIDEVNKSSLPSVSVEVDTIDAFVERENIDKVSFMEIDVEGSESNIIEGAKKTIKQFTPVIAISAYHKKEDKREIPEKILSLEPTYKYKLHKEAEEDLIFWKDERISVNLN